ncbi:MAG TPA: AraC family transcriptional regulator [Lactovum miscens]|uniref:AraC family transcriptional regulator n=1 Tax=Lactovum miscens TaxID=190387 RepID=UPI002EDB9926
MTIKEAGFSNQRYIFFPLKSHQNHCENDLINYNFPTELGYYPSAHFHYKERKTGSSEYILIFCMKGKGFVQINEHIHSLSSNMIICIPKETPHLYFADEKDPWSILWMHFSSSDASFFPFIHNVVSINSMERKVLIEKHFMEIFSLCEKEYQLSTAICVSKLQQLLLTEIFFLKDTQNMDQQNILLDKAIRYLNKHLNEHLSIALIAEHLDISGSYLSFIFKKYYKKGPIDFLIDLRIEQACKYLRISNLKTYAIAKLVGYEDPYYFSRLFKKKIGQSPKVYKQFALLNKDLTS